MTIERDARGWEMGHGASCSRRGTGIVNIDVNIDDGDMAVDIDGHKGEMGAYGCIPISYVVQMLRAKGYAVTPPSCPNYDARVKCDCPDCCARKFEP